MIPLGTLAQSNAGTQFATTQEGTIFAGQTTIDLPATAVNPGEAANGLVPGQITQLVSWHSPFLVSVTNTTMTTEGSDVETDDHLRARIWMAPESFSTAGPEGAYEYWAASANPAIMDVSVWSDPPNAGKVYIYPLMDGGRLPTTEECAQVYAVCNADRIRPLTDQVFVQPPTPIQFHCIVKYWIKKADGQFAVEIQQKVQEAYQEYLVWQSTKIGRDINPSKLDQMLVEAGAKRTDIPELTAFEFSIVDERSVAVSAADSALTYEGLEEE